jgi:hypothetical protein
MDKERNPVDIGYPPGSQPTPDEIREANRRIHIGESLPESVRSAVAAISNGVQDGADEVIAYTRREPAAALTMALTLGFLVGLSVAIGGVAAGWFIEQKPKRNFMSRLADLSSRTSLRDWAGR